MPDRIEREIEEILAKLEDGPPGAVPPERKPISISSARKKSAKPKPPRQPGRSPLDRFNLPAMMFAGAGLMVAGLVLSGISGGFIWVSFAGVLVFLAAFVLSFIRSGGRPASTGQAPGHFWRDRYITYQSPSQGAWGRLKRRFRR
jgi:hypothetical protein